MCECLYWADCRPLWVKHHQNCPQYDPVKDANELITKLVHGMDEWASLVQAQPRLGSVRRDLRPRAGLAVWLSGWRDQVGGVRRLESTGAAIFDAGRDRRTRHGRHRNGPAHRRCSVRPRNDCPICRRSQPDTRRTAQPRGMRAETDERTIPRISRARATQDCVELVLGAMISPGEGE